MGRRPAWDDLQGWRQEGDKEMWPSEYAPNDCLIYIDEQCEKSVESK